MQMNRRKFIGSTAAISAISLVTLPALGCTSSVTDLINVALASGEAIIAVTEPGAPWLANLRDAVAALQTAETQWKAGSAITIVESALNTLAAVCAVIPLTAVYSPLIDLLVAGIDAVLNAIAPAPVSTLKAKNNLRVGRATLHKKRAFQSEVGAYKEQWNVLVSLYPELAAAKLK